MRGRVYTQSLEIYLTKEETNNLESNILTTTLDFGDSKNHLYDKKVKLNLNYLAKKKEKMIMHRTPRKFYLDECEEINLTIYKDHHKNLETMGWCYGKLGRYHILVQLEGHQ